MKTPLLFVICLSGAALAQQPPTPSAKPSPEPFTTIDSISAVVPATVSIRTDGKWNVVGIEQASDAVTSKAQSRSATLSLKVHVFESFKERGWAYRIMAPDGRTSVRGTSIPYRVWAYFRADQADALAKVRKGSTVTLSGTIGRADIELYGGNPVLTIDLHDAKVEKR